MRAYIVLDRDHVLDWLTTCLSEAELSSVRERIASFCREVEALTFRESDSDSVCQSSDETVLVVRRDILLEDLGQVAEAHTLARARYYLERLRRGVSEVRTSSINDINLNRWKEYDEILTDSLWMVEKRDSSGAHGAWYWGNFVPQIPRQLMLRYTRAGDWVLDPFVGSGTTLIECRRLGRNGMGVELNEEVADQARRVVAQEPNPYKVTTEITIGDSTRADFSTLLSDLDVARVQLALLHPPYHDIISFNSGAGDLSGAPTVEDFIAQFSAVVARTLKVLEPGRHLAVVIGDKYQEGAWVPLGFYAMQAVMALGCTLKSIVVKNFDQTRAKRAQQALWRYRALVGGFYVFKHEYIYIFQV